MYLIWLENHANAVRISFWNETHSRRKVIPVSHKQPLTRGFSSRRQRFSSQACVCVADTGDYHHVASEKEQGINGVINCTNYWIWTCKSCRKRIILIAVNSGITSLETGSGRTVCWHLREGKTERAIFRIQGLCAKMPAPIIWLQNAKRKEHFSESDYTA